MPACLPLVLVGLLTPAHLHTAGSLFYNSVCVPDPRVGVPHEMSEERELQYLDPSQKRGPCASMEPGV